MKNLLQTSYLVFFLVPLFLSCKGKNKIVPPAEIDALNLKRGQVISCGPPGAQFGSVNFNLSCSEKVKKDFNLGAALLHSFEYDEAEKVFAKVIDEEPECAMAYWGVAMSNFHALWAPPTQEELAKGAKAVEIARSLGQVSKRESGYIEAIASFYKDWEKVDHRSRCINFKNAMEALYKQYPDDKETAIFFALSLVAAADPTDKTYAFQKKAGTLLNELYPGQPDHPGIVHYIIHTYDYPGLAELGLSAARKYAAIAPASAHARHMPSHIFTRLGLWDECIQSNLAAVASAKCYGETAGIKGHWDEELHGLDYLVYAYLQKGENKSAKEQLDYLNTINEVSPLNFKVAYAFAAIPSRYVLENKLWKEAAAMEIHRPAFPWEKFPWQKAIIHFTRLLGSVHINDMNAAREEFKNLTLVHDSLVAQKDEYKAKQVEVQIKTSEAWILFKEGKNDEALKLMHAAADMEDATEKHSVTPGEVLPARELLGDMLMQMNKPAEALIAYQADLERHANRFNGLYAAGLAAEKTGNTEKAGFYYKQLPGITAQTNSQRPELNAARLFLKNRGL
jgi:tetratricopeptide (TPR) repeat protein